MRRLNRLATRFSVVGAVIIASLATAPSATPTPASPAAKTGAHRDTAKAAAKAAPRIVPADLTALQAEIKKPGARAVLVNIWASWCDPCREEMPDLLRFYRTHRKEGVRLLLVSADDKDELAPAEAFLREQGVEFDTYLKVDRDMPFIAAFDKSWSGALPASFLYDGKGEKRHFWSGKVTHDALEAKLAEVLGSPRKTKTTSRRPK